MAWQKHWVLPRRSSSGLFRSIDKYDKLDGKAYEVNSFELLVEFDEDAVALSDDQAQVVENFLQLTNEGTDSLVFNTPRRAHWSK